MAYLPWYTLPAGLTLWKCAGLILLGQSYKTWTWWSFLFKALIRNWFRKHLFTFYNSSGLGKEAWECHAEERGLGPLGPPAAEAAATPKKVLKVQRRQVTCSSSWAWCFSSRGVSYLAELGCTFCAAGTFFPHQHKPDLPFWIGPTLFPSDLHPSCIGGGSRSGIYTSSKARKKDLRDPREKSFPTLVLFIRLLLLPLKAPPCSTVAPLCCLGHSVFSCTCDRALQ